MKVLIVEDQTSKLEELKDIIKDISFDCSIDTASSKASALRLVNDDEKIYDVISLDRNIPTCDGWLDGSTDVGESLLSEIKEKCPGTPIIVLTGEDASNSIPLLLNACEQVDIWSEGKKRKTLIFVSKRDLNVYKEELQSINDALNELAYIELENDSNIQIPEAHQTLLRIFIKSNDGVLAKVKPVGGGLSDSKVYYVEIKNSIGKCTHRVIAKLGKQKDIEEDASNYDKYINMLSPNVTPRKIGDVHFGARDLSGVFYSYATGFSASLYNVALTPSLNEELQSEIKLLVKEWNDAASETRKQIKDIRRRLLTDTATDQLKTKFELSWIDEFENRPIQVNESIIHGDLHGENILVNKDEGTATLIDYGDVGIGASVIDPLTLECSFLFHPSAQVLLDSGWPTLEQVSNWDNEEAYATNSPIKHTIKFCRTWINECKASNREVAACLYSYALRQLKYPQTNKEHAKALLSVARKIYKHGW